MTEPSDPDIEGAIRVLRRDILEGGRNVDWEAIRARIRRLLIAGRPSPDERITLLELYGQLVSRVERVRALNADSLRRVCNQRRLCENALFLTWAAGVPAVADGSLEFVAATG